MALRGISNYVKQAMSTQPKKKKSPQMRICQNPTVNDVNNTLIFWKACLIDVC